MISEITRRVDPWYRDRGVQASIVYSLFVLAFNTVAAQADDQQVNGLLAAAPILAAVLVQRVWRVGIAAGFAALVFLIGYVDIGLGWDRAQLVRILAFLALVVVGLAAADKRLKAASRLVALVEVAKTAQRAIMRLDPPEAQGVDAAVRYVSASSEANIGGDAYEALLTPFGLRVLVADARGKGMPAVLSSAVAVGSFREWAFIEEDLGDLIRRMNASVSREVNDADFVTAVVAQFCDYQLKYACAGHPPPLLLRDGIARELDVDPVPPLSLLPDDTKPVVSSQSMRRDDVVLMYSDGLTDSRNVYGRYFGLSDSLVRVASQTATVEECADGVLAELRDFVEDELEDDVALVALRVTRGVESLAEPADE